MLFLHANHSFFSRSQLSPPNVSLYTKTQISVLGRVQIFTFWTAKLLFKGPKILIFPQKFYFFLSWNNLSSGTFLKHSLTLQFSEVSYLKNQQHNLHTYQKNNTYHCGGCRHKVLLSLNDQKIFFIDANAYRRGYGASRSPIFQIPKVFLPT